MVTGQGFRKNRCQVEEDLISEYHMHVLREIWVWIIPYARLALHKESSHFFTLAFWAFLVLEFYQF